MTKLTNNQKKFLRARGQSLKPVVMIGQQGLSASVLAELEHSIDKHELLKIKIRSNDREEKQGLVDKIVQVTGAHLVQLIGNILVIYRPFDKAPQIVLPRK